MIPIQNSDGILHCGGVIAASDKVITAAHCFFDKTFKKEMKKERKQSYKIVAGAVNPFEFHGE